MGAVASHAPELGLREVRFVLFSDADLKVYQQALSDVAPSEASGR